MSKFTLGQISGAKQNARLHGITQEITDEQAIAYLEWYHSHKTEYQSVEEAARGGLARLDTTGIPQQLSAWQDILQIRRF